MMMGFTLCAHIYAHRSRRNSSQDVDALSKSAENIAARPFR